MSSGYIKLGLRKQSTLKLYVIAIASGLTLIACVAFVSMNYTLDKKTVNELVEARGRLIKANLLLEFDEVMSQNGHKWSSTSVGVTIREKAYDALERLQKSTGNPKLDFDDIPHAKKVKLDAIEKELKGLGKSLALKALGQFREDNIHHNIDLVNENGKQIIIDVEKRLAPLMN